MKRIFLMLVLSSIAYSGVAQYNTASIYTPNGSKVYDTGTFVGSDFTPYQQSLIIDNIIANYNSVVIISNPTNKYNCHAYAWHITEGGSNIWLGLSSTTAHSIYWTDQSYAKVPENVATKVVYAGNHSAIRLNSTWYQSKWGPGALVKHHPNNVPVGYLPSSTKHYYTRGISGPSNPDLNINYNYTVPAPPSGVTFNNWKITPYIITASGTTSRNLTTRFTSAGRYTLTANFTLPNSTTYSVSRTVDVPGPLAKPSISRDMYVVCPGETLTCTVDNPDFSAVYDWELDGTVWARDWRPDQPLLALHYYLDSASGSSTIRCRSRRGSELSEWSNPLLIYVSDTPLWP
jgi:hypothetical protein